MRLSQRHGSLAQVDQGVVRGDAELREGLLPTALAAMEAALRRAPDLLGAAAGDGAAETAARARPRRHPLAEPRRLRPRNGGLDPRRGRRRAGGAARGRGAAGGGPRRGRRAGRKGAARDAGQAACDRARAGPRLARRAQGAPRRLPRRRSQPGAGRRARKERWCRALARARQDALTTSIPHLVRAKEAEGLPAGLRPCAAAHLLPQLLLPPERVRALEPPSHSPASSDDRVADFLCEVVVRAAPARRRCGRRLLYGLPWAARTDSLCGRAGPLRPARGGRQPRRVQGARAGVRGRGALCRAGAAHAGRPPCAPPWVVPMLLRAAR